jgi:hypothetical protein
MSTEQEKTVKPYDYEVGHWMVAGDNGQVTIVMGTQLLGQRGKREAVPLKEATVEALQEVADRLIATGIAMHKDAQTRLTGVQQ